MHSLRDMVKYIRKNQGIWLLGLFLSACFSMATNIYFANRLQSYVTLVTQNQSSLQSIFKMLLMTLPVLLLLSCIDNLGLYMFSLFLALTEKELRYDYCGSLLCASFQNLRKLKSGELLTRYTTDIEQSAQIVSYDIFGVIYPLLVGTGYMTAVLLSNPWIGGIMLVLGVAVIVSNFMFVRGMKHAQEEILRAKEVYTTDCINAIHGKMSIRQYSAKEMMGKRIGEGADRLYGKEYRAVRLKTLKVLTSDTLANCCVYLLTPLACVMAVCGYMSVSLVLFIHQLCRCFIMYTQNFASSFIYYSEHELSYARVSDVLSFPDETAGGGVIPHDSFPEKSSISDISLPELREHIAFSPEQGDVFRGTVYENIRLGKRNASEQEIFHAADRAALTYGEAFFQQNVGEHGEQLSGGQRQKVSIARALIKNAPIFVFDEPTAALDADSESELLKTILELKREGKCILLITHKKSTLRVADRILRIK